MISQPDLTFPGPVNLAALPMPFFLPPFQPLSDFNLTVKSPPNHSEPNPHPAHRSKTPEKPLEENSIHMRPSNKRIEQRDWAESASFARNPWQARSSS